MFPNSFLFVLFSFLSVFVFFELCFGSRILILFDILVILQFLVFVHQILAVYMHDLLNWLILRIRLYLLLEKYFLVFLSIWTTSILILCKFWM